MKAAIVLCHPFERSFCSAVAQSLLAGFKERPDQAGTFPLLHDLYAEGPDPLLTGAEIARRFSMDEQIQRYSEEVQECDLLCIVHPDWWSGPPALLKGWLERVFRPGVAYNWEGEEFSEKHHVALLSGKELAVFVTTDRVADDPPRPIEGFWRDAAAYCGMHLNRYTVFADLRRSGHRQRKAWLEDVRVFACEGGARG